jgi:hypothetical protein
VADIIRFVGVNLEVFGRNLSVRTVSGVEAKIRKNCNVKGRRLLIL